MTVQLYGVANGQYYRPADGSNRELLVVDADKYAASGDIVVRDLRDGREFIIDAFKLAIVRYTLVAASKR